MSQSSITTKRRTAYTISTISVALVLFMIGAIFYLILNAAKATSSVLDNMKVVVILKENTSKVMVEEIEKIAKQSSFISGSEYVSAEKAEADFKAYIGEDFSLKLGSNPLPASINLNIDPNVNINTKESIEKLRNILKKIDEVDEILYQENVIDNVISNISNFKIILASFCLILLFVSFIMIDNTIKMAVLSKRFLIKTMLLIGATKGFIRRPFVYKAIMQSLWSTIIASIMLASLIVLLKRTIPDIEIIYENYEILLIIPATMFVIGVIVCVSSTISAVNRYMNLDDNELYTY